VSVPANVPLNLGLINALKRLGIQGSVIPGLGEGIQPVLIVGDIAQSVASELVEARRTATSFIITIFPSWAVAELVARAPGGLVVERVELLSEEIAGSAPRRVFYQILPDPIPAGGGVVACDESSEIGGIATASRLLVASQIVNPEAVGAETASIFCLWDIVVLGTTYWWGSAQTRIYVPPGHALRFFNVQGERMGITITWRELADVQGEN
jgi:hypothetical protein